MTTNDVLRVVLFAVYVGGIVLSIVLTGRRMRAHNRIRRVTEAQGGPIPPLTIRPEPDPNPEPWAEAAAREFEALGFTRVGAFRYPPTSTRAVSLVDATGCLFVSVGTQLLLGRNRSVAGVTEAGDYVEVVDVDPSAYAAWMPPFMSVRGMPGASAYDLVAAIGRDPRAPGFITVAAAELPALAASLHRRQIEWIFTHRPPSPESILRLEAITGEWADPESLAFLAKVHGARGVYPRTPPRA